MVVEQKVAVDGNGPSNTMTVMKEVVGGNDVADLFFSGGGGRNHFGDKHSWTLNGYTFKIHISPLVNGSF